MFKRIRGYNPRDLSEWSYDDLGYDKFLYRSRASYAAVLTLDMIKDSREEGLAGVVLGAIALACVPQNLLFTWLSTFDEDSKHYLVQTEDRNARILA